VRVESGRDGDSTSIGEDQFEVGSGDRERRDGIGQNGNREEVVVGTGGQTIIAGSGHRGGLAGLVEVLAEGMKRDLTLVAELRLSQTATAEVVEEGIPT
jgi:hypothetical protein